MSAAPVSIGEASVRMDRIYRRQRHFYDLTRKYFLFGRDALVDRLEPPSGAHVCEVGCGTARNLVRIARRYPWARLYGLDASGEMLKTAEAKAAGVGLAGRIALRQGLAERLDPQAMFGVTRGFDVVVLSYVLSMVPDWSGALKAALAAVRPGGAVEIVDFGDIDRLPAGLGRPLGAWLARFEVTPRPEIQGMLRAHERAGRGRAEIRRVLGDYAFLARFVRAD
jgi:S-adenosylmethionine-diacylgycerolhomoserine-N-methlytransferase